MGIISPRKKILYLVTQSEWGGAQKYIYDLANGLDKNKYIIEVGVGGGEERNWLKNLQSKGIKIWRLKHVVREINLWHDFLSSFELYALLCKSKPDIVHLNSSKIGSTGAVISWIYKKTKNKELKIIYTVHGFVFLEPLPILRKKFYLWSERISGSFKDKIICVSEHDKIIGLNSHIANHQKFITIHNGIDLDESDFLSKNEAIKKLSGKIFHKIKNKKIIGTLANLYSTKGLEYLIRAAKKLTHQNPALIFIVIGEGMMRKSLEQKIQQLNLANKFFLPGYLPKAFRYLKAFDIFCLSSIKEGFPYTLIEALAAGLPIVTTRVGGVIEIVEPDVNGLVVPPQRPNELAKALQKILSNKNLQEKFNKNNLKKIKKFNLQGMIKKTEEVYSN